MQVKLSDGRFVAVCSYREKDIPKAAGFMWDPKARQWWTGSWSASTRPATAHGRVR